MSVKELAGRLLSACPGHKASLTLTHNDHLNDYMTVAGYLERRAFLNPDDDSGDGWVSAEERQRAIDTNEMWELRWYPHTPVGFEQIAASSLEALLTWAANREGE